MKTDVITLTVKAVVHVPVDKAWEYWTEPRHVVNWNHASEDWHSPHASNDLRPGGKFLYRMEAKDGSHGFDFSGIYDEVKPYQTLSYVMDDGRKVSVVFTEHTDATEITETFEAENVYSIGQQQSGWQAIMDNFKRYAESIRL